MLKSRPALFALSWTLIAALPACSGEGAKSTDDAGPGSGGVTTGGTSASGGATGGLGSGGVFDPLTGGSGGAGTGGQASGGQASGGQASGGTSTGGVATGGAATGGTGGLPPLEECDTPSIDRLQEWLASGEGPTDPATGSLLTPIGESYVAQATFTSNSEWHVLVVYLGNQWDASMDLTGSSGFTLTYSATSDFYIQLRPSFNWDGGDKWHMPIPSTGGVVQTAFFPFDSGSWIQKLGAPGHTFDEALAAARGFVIVGNTQNDLEFHGLRIDGYEPPCL